MLAQKKTIKVLMFLLPAVVSLIAYTAYHEMLFRKPPCLINCGQPGVFSDNEKIKKWLAYLESLRDDTFGNKVGKNRTSPTPLDLAFLEDKIHLASNDNDYLTRYQQIIRDLNTPNIVKSENSGKEYVGVLDKVAPLTYISTDQDPNNQVFAILPDDETDSSPFDQSRISPYNLPIANGPSYFVGGGSPNNNEGNSQGGGSDGNNPNNGGGPSTGNTGGGSVIPTVPGGNGNNAGGGNPISSVPLPSAGLMVAALVLVVAGIRFKISQRIYS